MIPLGKIIRILRDEHHLSQQQLAQKIGVTKSTVGLYESGDRFPSLPTLIALSRSLGVSTDYLLGLDKQKQYYLDISDLTPKQINSVNLIIENYRDLRH